MGKERLALIHICEVKELVGTIEGEYPILNIERVIDMPQAVQALRCGIPMATIVRELREALENYIIQHVLGQTQGNKSEAARRLRIDDKTLYRKLQKYTTLQ
jgi:transcriptional regulator with PAS, ATPase and Fis domain